MEFNIYKEVFLAERGPLLVVLLISIIIGVLALFGAYYQRYLFLQLLDPEFETSGWVFFSIISVSAILRFFLFNVKYLLISVCTKYSQLNRLEYSLLPRKFTHESCIALT